MSNDLLFGAFVLILAIFLGFEVISKVPPLLHTPLMSGSNMVSGIIVIGAMLVVLAMPGPIGAALGWLAVLLGTINVVGGYVVTDRMLVMFRRARPSGPKDGR